VRVNPFILMALGALANPSAAAPRVVADIPPVHALAAEVMRGVGAPDLILPPGAHPHDYAMRPSEAALLGDADVVFWIGEDKLIFGADYAIWEPKWQVEGFVDWQMPDDDEFGDYSKLTVTQKKKILGLNAARLYDLKVPGELDVSTPPVEPVGVPTP